MNQPQADTHLSASQLRCYGSCSLKWYLSRHHEPEFVPSSLIFGSAFHHAIETFYQNRLQGQTITAHEMLQAFDEHWAKEDRTIQYGARENRESLFTTASRMLDAFVEAAGDSIVLALEEPFTFELAEDLPPVVGFIDLIEVVKDEQGERLKLVDFKTACRRPSGPDDMDPDQLVLYSLAARHSGLIQELNLPLELEYRVLTKTKSPELVSLPVTPGRWDEQRLIAKARAIWHGMAGGLIFPCPGWMCGSCGYAGLCRQWPDLPKPIA